MKFSHDRIADILTLQVPDRESAPAHPPPQPRSRHGRRAAPRGSQARRGSRGHYQTRRRTVTIRHISDHRIVALLEIISPGNKDRASSFAGFVDKVDSSLGRNINVFVADLFPPGKHDPRGMHGAIWIRYDLVEYVVPPDQPLTLVSYSADGAVEAYVEHLKVGDPLIEMPIFLDDDFYINLPLEATYQAAYRGVPEFWRDLIERKQPLS